MALPAELMENVPTLEEFWAAFTKSQEEFAQRIKQRDEEFAQRMKQLDEKSAQRMKQLDEESVQRMKQDEDFARRMKQNDEDFARRMEQLDEKNKRNQEKFWESLRETERIVKNVGKQMGDLHNRFGELAEHLVAPGIIRRFNELGYHFDDTIAERVRLLDNSGQKILTEIDLLLENGEYSIAVEVKSRPTEKDVVHHENRLTILREHKDRRNDRRKIRGAIAGAVFPEDVKAAAIGAGLYVIEQSGDTMKINVPEGFRPREW